MDVVELLEKAKAAKFKVKIKNGKLYVEGPKTEKRIHEQLQAHEEEIKAHLNGDPEPEDQPGEKEPSLVRTLTNIILEESRFAVDVGGKLYRYNEGTYRTKGEAFIRQRVKSLCIAKDLTKNWKKSFAEECVEFIRVDADELWESPLPSMVNVKNGLLNLRNGRLLPHRPDSLSPVQLPITYHPKATCPNIENFVKSCFPADAIDLAWESTALLIAPNSIQKAILLLGEGGNGKSVWLNVQQKLLGRNNYSSVPLHQLESDRFKVARIMGKLANICADLPSKHLDDTSIFKQIVGGDTLEGEFKFRDSFSFTPFCTLVFSANSPPRSGDSSEGFFDRWLVIPFEGKFRGTKQEVSREVLDRRLTTEMELSGLLNKAVDAWQAMQKRGGRLSEPTSVRTAWEEFYKQTDPLSVWLDRYTVDDPDAVVPKQVLRAAYGAACEREGRPSPTDRAFGLAIQRARPQIKKQQRTVNGRVQWCYVGICMAGDSPATSQDSQDSQDNAPLSHAGDKESTEKSLKAEYPVNPVNPVSGNQSRCSRCGGVEFEDIPLSKNSSFRVRRDCSHCGQTIGLRK